MSKHLLPSLLLLLPVTLVGCNGQEDFSDAIIAGEIIDGGKVDPNFNPENACSSRVVGNLVNGGIVKNIGYECGGYRGYTGDKGIPSEENQNRFVCPLFSKSVSFFIGGLNDPREYLGTANFRVAQPAAENFDDEGNNICQYDEPSDTFTTGVYDADGPYILSVADLFDGPVRVDVITDAEPNEQVAQNVSALLTGLDTNVDKAELAIDFEAHRVILDEDISFADDFFEIDFSTFVSGAGDAQAYLDAIKASDPAAAGTLPLAEQDVEQILSRSNDSTAAGIYQFDLRQEDYFFLGYWLEQATGTPAADQLYMPEALVTDYLLTTLLSPSMGRSDPADPDTQDLVPLVFAQDFFPFMLIDRNNRLIGGGAFDMARTLAAGGAAEHLCQDQPVYLALSAAAELSPDLTMVNMNFQPVASAPLPEVGEINIPGRFIDGVAYSGVKANIGGSKTDYELAYDGSGHVFDTAKDQSIIKTGPSLCGETIDSQIILSFRRQGIVMPTLDTLIMDEVFAVNTPARYTLKYMARAVASDALPDQMEKVSLNVTIHNDGTIISDIDANDNSSYDTSGVIPANEHLVGMVSSVVPGVDSTTTPMVNEYVTEAQINILVFAFGPENIAGTLPAYGSHFRARLVPDTACTTQNALFFAGDETLTTNAYWFDSYNITNWLRQSSAAATDDEKYTALRTIAYGFIEGERTDCP